MSPSVPKTRNKSPEKPADKRGTKNPPRATQTSAADPRGVVSNPITSKEKKPDPTPGKTSAHRKATPGKGKAKASNKTTSLGVTESDSLGYKLASLPIPNKDKELVARLLHEELGIKDVERFMREVHRVDVPTPKT